VGSGGRLCGDDDAAAGPGPAPAGFAVGDCVGCLRAPHGALAFGGAGGAPARRARPRGGRGACGSIGQRARRTRGAVEGRAWPPVPAPHYGPRRAAGAGRAPQRPARVAHIGAMRRRALPAGRLGVHAAAAGRGAEHAGAIDSAHPAALVAQRAQRARQRPAAPTRQRAGDLRAVLPLQRAVPAAAASAQNPAHTNRTSQRRLDKRLLADTGRAVEREPRRTAQPHPRGRRALRLRDPQFGIGRIGEPRNPIQQHRRRQRQHPPAPARHPTAQHHPQTAQHRPRTARRRPRTTGLPGEAAAGGGRRGAQRLRHKANPAPPNRGQTRRQRQCQYRCRTSLSRVPSAAVPSMRPGQRPNRRHRQEREASNASPVGITRAEPQAPYHTGHVMCASSKRSASRSKRSASRRTRTGCGTALGPRSPRPGPRRRGR